MSDDRQSKQEGDARWPVGAFIALGVMLLLSGSVLHPALWPAVVLKALVCTGGGIVAAGVIAFLVS